MDLDSIVRSFFERMFEIDLVQRSVKSNIKNEIKRLSDLEEQFNSSNVEEDLRCSMHSMFYYYAPTGGIEHFGFCELSVQERIKRALFRKNKEYCWLLAEAYEEFEDFLEKTYSYIGESNNAAWLMSDFGNISITDIPSKNYEWYLNQAKKKRNIPKSILERFRCLYPRLKRVENNNGLGVNLNVALNLIESLRHIIVHKAGKVGNKEVFIENVLKSSGVLNNGNYLPEYRLFIEQFFGHDGYENNIILLEIPDRQNGSFESYYDVYGILPGYLLSYASILYECIADKKLKLQELKPL